MDVFLWILGFIFSMAILQSIISAGTKTRARLEIEQTQLRILIALAKQMGVADEQIAESIKPHKKKGRFF